ncbi:Retinol dehydrogenase 14 [Trichinella patagoniensis]|uniref:Retinol dehydrogenase 14 n=1 Tax=Trichinella patagoniensis TaxID=990121 RepID=A0A0V1AA09_9BILA|nr:Retinol dehydrogenase 14 [Trichinella patagoniensis]
MKLIAIKSAPECQIELRHIQNQSYKRLVNHLAHFALVCLLLDTVKNNAPSRLIIVSSLCYNWFSIDWDDLMGENDYEKYKQYSRTKLMNHMFTFALARRLAGTKVTCNVYEPGVVETKLLRAGGYHGAHPITGARTAVYLVESEEVSNVSGEYFDRRQKKIEAELESRLENIQEKLWDNKTYGISFVNM